MDVVGPDHDAATIPVDGHREADAGSRERSADRLELRGASDDGDGLEQAVFRPRGTDEGRSAREGPAHQQQ
jgi:hypothetical protein